MLPPRSLYPPSISSGVLPVNVLVPTFRVPSLKMATAAVGGGVAGEGAAGDGYGAGAEDAAAIVVGEVTGEGTVTIVVVSCLVGNHLIPAQRPYRAQGGRNGASGRFHSFRLVPAISRFRSPLPTFPVALGLVPAPPKGFSLRRVRHSRWPTSSPSPATATFPVGRQGVRSSSASS